MSDQWYFKIGPEITEGLHGTDEQTALDIVKTGFKHNVFDELSLADPEDEYLARGHGKKNAERTGRNRYAILHTTFPPQAKKEGIAGPPCIRLLGNEIAEVSVIGMAIYRASDDRMLEAYDEDSLNLLRR